ncbi:MAG TPA: DUF72 domain-containing protein, partial [Usitatibacter sp.]|nr:DUF72 domain-containing protein [Usitatibacter sp.]
SGGQSADDSHRASSTPPPPRKSRDVYCYFDNDAKVKAPFDAMRLTAKLGLGMPKGAARVDRAARPDENRAVCLRR